MFQGIAPITPAQMRPDILAGLTLATFVRMGGTEVCGPLSRFNTWQRTALGARGKEGGRAR